MTGLPDSQSFFRVSSPCSSSSLPSLACPCGSANATTAPRFRLLSPTLRARRRCLTNGRKGRGLRRGRPCMFVVSAVQAADGRPRFGFKLETDKRRGHQLLVVNNLSNQFQGYQTFDDDEEEEQGDEELQEAGQPERWDDDSYIRTTPKSQERKQGIKLPTRSRFTTFQEDPMVDKLRTQLGPMHPIPTPPLNRNVIAALFVFFFAFGVLFDKLWTARKRSQAVAEARAGIWPQVPTSFSLFLEKDLQRKESVEWVNMVVAKLWKVYREGLENWLIGLLQPVVDDLKKPDYVERVEIKQFDLGEAPLSVRNVERRTSRRANDLQYQIGLRYTGDARMLLSLKLKFGIIPVVVPVGIRDFDIDGELWVKLRLIPSEPWVGALSWAFVSLPKIKFVLSPFRLFNLMGIPVLSMFLLKLLTEDLPRLFVRPKKIVLDFQKGKALGPVPDDFTTDTVQEGNRDFVGELSVTLVDARRLVYFFFAKTDPYVILSLGNQVIRSKKNSQTTVIGPPGEPIWNQDFHMFVTNPRKQKLTVQVKDSIGFTDITIGSAEVELGSLQDTVPTDKIVSLRGSWTPLNRGFAGEILVRLTYKAYVEDEEEDTTKTDFTDRDTSDDEMFESDEISGVYEQIVMDYTVKKGSESFMDVLTALIVSEEFRGIVDSAARSTRVSETSASSQPSTPVTLTSSAESTEDISDDSRSGDPVLLWLAAITSLTTLISVNIGGSSLFNP